MRVATLIALLFLTACARWTGVSESWHGRSLDELVAYWGPPDNSYKYDNGSLVVTFKHQHQVSGFNPYAPYQSAVYKCTASFTMDPHTKNTFEY